MLIHGLGCSSRSWQRVVPLLSGEVVAVDLPSFESIEEAAEHVARLDVRDAVVAGHSMGGVVGVALAEAAPAVVSRLVLINSPPTYESRITSRGGQEKLIRQPVVGRALWKLAGDARMRSGLRSAFAPGYDVPDVFVEDLLATPWSQFVAATTAIDDYLAERPLHARLGALPVPATVLFGEQDQRVDPESLKGYDGVAGVEVQTLPGVGHTPIWEAPEQVVEVVGRGG